MGMPFLLYDKLAVLHVYFEAVTRFPAKQLYGFVGDYHPILAVFFLLVYPADVALKFHNTI